MSGHPCRAAPETARSDLNRVAVTHKTYILPTKYETVNSGSINRLISYSILPYDLISIHSVGQCRSFRSQ